MSFRTVTRATAVLGAAAALTVAGAGAAMAASISHDVDNETNTISVTFGKEGFLDGDLCVAAVVPQGEAAGVIEKVQAASNLDINAIGDLLTGNTDATLLRGGALNTPVVSVILGGVTVSATVEPNVYSLVSVCTGTDPYIVPTVMVGNPLEAIQGSIATMSTGDSLGALSTVIQGGDSGLLAGGSSNLLGGGTDSAGE